MLRGLRFGSADPAFFRNGDRVFDDRFGDGRALRGLDRPARGAAVCFLRRLLRPLAIRARCHINRNVDSEPDRDADPAPDHRQLQQ
jgi:hypothetical protein